LRDLVHERWKRLRKAITFAASYPLVLMFVRDRFGA
jgi:hypothetical protein